MNQKTSINLLVLGDVLSKYLNNSLKVIFGFLTRFVVETYALLTKLEVKLANIGQLLFYVFMDLEEAQVHIKQKKKGKKKKQGQYQPIWTEKAWLLLFQMTSDLYMLSKNLSDFGFFCNVNQTVNS